MYWFAGSYSGAVLSVLVINMVAGRWLGPRDFGVFVTALTASALLGQVGLLGSHRSGLREVARLRDSDDREAMAVLRNGVRAVSLTSLPLAGLVGGVGAWVVQPGEAVLPRLQASLAVAALVVLGGQQQLWANYVRGLGHTRFASLLEGRSGGALVAALQAMCMGLAWVLAPDAGVGGALLAVAAGFLVPVLAARQVVRRRWRGLGGPAPHLRRDLAHTARRDWRFLSAQVAAFLNVSVELWIATLLLTRVDASMFSAGQRLALLLLLPLTAMQVVLAPVIARDGPRDGPHDGAPSPPLEGIVRTATTAATGVALLLALPLVVAPGAVIRILYGEGFGGAVPVMLLLAVGTLGNVATGVAGTALSMQGQERVAAWVQWSGAILRVALGVPAALLFGLHGLTLSALTVAVFVFTVMWWAAHRVLGLYTHCTIRPDFSLLRRTTG